MKFKHRLSGTALALALAGPAAAQVGMARLELPDLPVTLIYPTTDHRDRAAVRSLQHRGGAWRARWPPARRGGWC